MQSNSVNSQMLLRISTLFAINELSIVQELLESECGGNLPLIEKQGVEGIERIRCAVLRLSEGSMEKLHRAIEIAKFDWRDVLVASGFANDLTSHLVWLRNEQ